ncbi:glycerol-3-phosphate acyltransferase 2, mitochondrial isoform X1 [Esox lucius]|uniref:GPAT/DHAPAT C-terminal domain-containing protein n=1 Tax=Esox lucius TaxID=8010 RepID=A0AAY5L0P2_ESOLU|nr:glycerol-3-phosphate acyltransferase 2, mitochondrial isoform X1 [Esox lucius]XP_012992216.2 glycerol-3-phosphate acyltransferase 2, mitochondrial isoform X1 [Esox lucius]
MVQESRDGFGEAVVHPATQQKRPALSWAVRIKKKLKTVTPYLGKFRPTVGQCCHQCTPDSLGKKLGQTTPSLGFQNLLRVNETHTRYRGWLVRRVCGLLFVRGCKVYPSPATDRVERVCQSNRVQKALFTTGTVPMGGVTWEQLTPYLPLINTCISPSLLRFVGWVILKVFGSVFCSIQVNLNHKAFLHRASQQGPPLVYVFVPQSVVDYALIPMVLFCHNLRVPYTLCHLQIHNNWLRSVLQRLGVVLLPLGPITEQEAETDCLYSPVMTSLVGELLCEGQALSVCVSGMSGHGGQWLARIRQAVTEGLVPDVRLVPVGISYDCIPSTGTPAGVLSALRCVFSLLFSRRARGCVRIHLAQPFSLKEMCNTGRCRVDGSRPLLELLLPTILHNRSDRLFGQRMMSWVLPPNYVPELSQSERDLSIALTLHLSYSIRSCMAVMSTSLVSCLLLHKHRKGVCLSVLCRDVAWLLEEVLFRNRDVGFGGSLVGVVYHALSLLVPHLIIAAHPNDRSDPLIAPHPSLSATLSLSCHAQILTHTFIQEAVGACAVSAMLYDVATCGGDDWVKGQQYRGEMEFDVALCQDELTERALQLTHLLPPEYIPPCQSSHDFALDAVDTLVRCGVLVMEEVPRDTPICDFWKKQGTLAWSATDDPNHSDSECEEGDARCYKLSQPSQCPELLFFLCSLMAGYLRALCWATDGLDLLQTPLPEAVCLAQIHSHLRDSAQRDRGHYESCSAEVARMTVRTLTDLGVLVEGQQRGCVFLGVSQLFQQTDSKKKLRSFVSQFLYD